MRKIIASMAMLTMLSGCNWLETSDDKQNAAQEVMNMQAVNAVGMPAINNFSEKKALKEILELRDRGVSTYTYYNDMQGRLHLLCRSIGYGISAATQFTNPQKIYYDAHRVTTIPQADPNGLYSPATAEGTWVLCLNPDTGKAAPVYSEPRIIVSQWDMLKQGN